MPFLWLTFQSNHNKDYDVVSSAGESAEHFMVYFQNGIMGIGRAAWQLVFPFRQAVYFDVNSVENVFGLFLFGLLVFFLFRIRKGEGFQEAKAFSF